MENFFTFNQGTSAGEALGLAGMGMLLVFAVLVFIMLVVFFLRWVINSFETRKTAVIDPVAVVVAHEESKAAAIPSGLVPAPGSSGEVALHTVDDKTAAMLMAIVADDLGCEPNTLTFTSIREL